MKEKPQFRIGHTVTARQDYVGDNNLKLTQGNSYIILSTRMRMNWCYVQIREDNGRVVWLRQRYFKIKLRAEMFIEGWMT